MAEVLRNRYMSHGRLEITSTDDVVARLGMIPRRIFYRL